MIGYLYLACQWVLWGDNLFQLFCCIFKIEIKTVNLYSIVMELLSMQESILFISLHFTGLQLTGLKISILHMNVVG